MRVTWRHVRFLARWVLFYNAELVWLCWRLPKRLPRAAALPPEADARRRAAHRELSEATARANQVCAACGRCCLERTNRFTPFDEFVRAATPSPSPPGDRRIYSLPWMVANAVAHGVQRLLRYGQPLSTEVCPYLEAEGCRLPREERPMLCVSWFCPRFVLTMSPAEMERLEEPLREVERLHRAAVRQAREARRGQR
ncbi:MAG: hypothetical protein QHJ73_07690 [Armatimonadota bacterium]|jgi:Fe-S-cluster containining protein|nr:hypothetical protein [Armatimonadota bacterium]